MHVYKELMRCESVCDIKSGIDPLPLRLGREQKMLGFSQVLKPIKWQDLEKEKMAAMHFEQVQRFIFAKKIFSGQAHFKCSWLGIGGSRKANAV